MTEARVASRCILLQKELAIRAASVNENEPPDSRFVKNRRNRAKSAKLIAARRPGG
jgi:hypothetical protein